MARNAQLEAAILQRPRDAELARVYADWLLAEGDVRGELAAVQYARSRQSSPREQARFKAREAQLLQQHEGALLGPLTRVAQAFSPEHVAWQLGFVRELRLNVRDDASADDLRALLSSPAYRFLEALELRGPVPAGVFDGLELPLLRRLLLHVHGEFPDQGLDTTVAGEGAFPLAQPGGAGLFARLDALGLDGSFRVRAIDFTSVRLPRLARLTVNVRIDGLTRAQVPALVEVSLGEACHQPEDVLESLAYAQLGRLERLVAVEGSQDAPSFEALRQLAPASVLLAVSADDRGALAAHFPGQVFDRAHHAERAFVAFQAAALDLAAARRHVRARLAGVEGAAFVLAPVDTLAGRLHVLSVRATGGDRAELPGLLAAELSERAPRSAGRRPLIVECSSSKSNEAFAVRLFGVGDGTVRALRHRSASDGPLAFRELVEGLWGLDPGLDALRAVFDALDAGSWEAVSGPLQPAIFDAPVCSLLEPDFREEDDEGEDEYDQDGEGAESNDALDWVQREDEDWYLGELDEPEPTVDDPGGAEPALDREGATVAVTVELPGAEAGQAEAAEEDVDDEPFRDAVDLTPDEILADSPVDLEDDGSEPHVEFGLDPVPPDPDALAEPADVEPIVCAICSRWAATVTCTRCGDEVCLDCGDADAAVCRHCAP